MRLITKAAIAANKGWIEDIDERVDEIVSAKIDALSPEEQWKAFLAWHGLIGWADTLHRVHKEIFK